MREINKNVQKKKKIERDGYCIIVFRDWWQGLP